MCVRIIISLGILPKAVPKSLNIQTLVALPTHQSGSCSNPVRHATHCSDGNDPGWLELKPLQTLLKAFKWRRLPPFAPVLFQP